MNEGLIPKRYAKALYKFACEKGAELGLYRLMGTLSRSFVDNPTLDSTIANPFVSDAEKIGLLKLAATATSVGSADASAVADSNVNDAFADFLKLLSNNKRLALAAAIARAYCDIYRKENRIYRVSVVSAKPLGQQEQDRLSRLIEAHLNGGKIEYAFSIDPELIGGFTVDINNERLDASVKNELKQLRLKLLKQA